MGSGHSQSICKAKPISSIHRIYNFLASKACTVIMFAAIFCTLAVKFFHCRRMGLFNEYLSWIVADVAVLLGIEIILAIVYLRLSSRWVLRIALGISAIVCTWSVMNAGWLIRTGTQILPRVLLPLFRDPLNTLGIIGVNLIKMPATAIILLAPSAALLGFFFMVFAKPQQPDCNRRGFAGRRLIISTVLVVIAGTAGLTVTRQGSAQIVSESLRYNCQLRGIISLVVPGSGRLAKADLAAANRKIPTFDQINIELLENHQQIYRNVVIVILEGVQYSHTSLHTQDSNLTPYLTSLAGDGVEFTNTRSSLTHTTKALFSLLTGRFPSVSQDLAEAVPASKPYAGLATILKHKLNFRTAFFQSAKGNFESRPGLVYNLGFDKFWAREDLNDSDSFIGYLGSDEFSMLNPITEWIKADDNRFLLTILCSVTHDPYEVPQWFAVPAREPLDRYRQTISYTDKFIAALDAALAELNLADSTIFCVVGDHGEAFGEHGLLGHERIAFDEVLRVPFCLRAPALIEPATKVTEPVSSVDLTPTLLALLGFDISEAGFDGLDALAPLPRNRRVYFSGWMQEGPAGFVKDNRKFIYNPTNKILYSYDLSSDPLELVRIELPQGQAEKIAEQITTWRKNSLFRIDQHRSGKKMLFEHWLCRWNNRICSARHYPQTKN